MKLVIFLIATILSMTDICAQKEKFDIASFIPPKGWQRLDSNGMVLFQNIRTNNGSTRFCQIFLFPSLASTGDPAKDFASEWNRIVVRATHTQQNLTTETQKTPDGWIETTGYANVQQQGITYTCMLVSISGFGKVMSVMVNVAGQEFMGEVQLFFNNMDMRAPVVLGDLNSYQKPPDASTGSLSDYVYTAPPGWSIKQYSDGIVISAPDHGNERCLLSLWPMRNAGSDLWTDANNIFAEVFKGYQPKNNGLTPNSIIKGISPQGWEYVIIKKSIGINGYATVFGFLFVARLGNQLAPISGISKDPMVSACFGLLQTDVWPKFFYSLQFRNWKNSAPGISKQIIGDWIGGGATAAGKFSFAPNGRYANAEASQQYHSMSDGEVLATTQGFFGDGAYTLKGNQITLIKDRDKNNPEHGYIRVEEESIDNGINWTEKLFLLRTSSVDGKEYEVSLRRMK